MRALKLQSSIEKFGRLVDRVVVVQAIPTRRAAIVGAAVLTVKCVPCVRQGHAGPCRIIERDVLCAVRIARCELPARRELDDRSTQMSTGFERLDVCWTVTKHDFSLMAGLGRRQIDSATKTSTFQACSGSLREGRRRAFRPVASWRRLPELARRAGRRVPSGRSAI
jgi:hypothetical protein